MGNKRQIIKIDEEKCTGCGSCIVKCAEGALELVNGKAKIVKDSYCDGLGACMGECLEGAITVIEREAEEYDEGIVMENIIKQGDEMSKYHLEHLLEHNEMELYQQGINYLKAKNIEIPVHGLKIASQECGCNHNHGNGGHQHEMGGCPGSKMIDLGRLKSELVVEKPTSDTTQQSHLKNWPIQLYLAPTQAPYFENADLLIVSDCVAASYPNLHKTFVKGKTLLIGCPKLDDVQRHVDKIAQILKLNSIRSIQILMMEVPCCSGMKLIVEKSLELSGKKGQIPITHNIISIEGNIK